jgi:hypothetical protein
MATTLETAVSQHLHSGNPARGTRAEYQTTLKEWTEWGGGVPIEQLGRREIGGFLDWVYEQAVAQEFATDGFTVVRRYNRVIRLMRLSRCACPKSPRPSRQFAAQQCEVDEIEANYETAACTSIDVSDAGRRLQPG